MGNILDGRGKGGVVFLGDYVTLPASSGAPDGMLPPLGSIRFNPLLEEVEVFRDDLKNGYEWRLLNAQTLDITQFYSKNGGPISGNMSLAGNLLGTVGTSSSPSISFALSHGTGLSTAGGALLLSSNGNLVASLTTNSLTLVPPVSGRAAIFGSLNATTVNADIITPVPFESDFFAPGNYDNAVIIHRMPATHVLRFLPSLTGSQAFAGVAPFTNTSITIKKVGSSNVETIVGSVNWLAGNRVGTFVCQSPFSVNAGESLVFVTDQQFDDVIADISVTIVGQSIYRVDSAPTDISISGPQQADEHSPSGTYIATVNAVDADDTEFSYSIVTQYSKEQRFAMLGNQIVWGSFGHLTATTGWPGTYRPVTIRATDPQGRYVQKTFQILIKDVIFGVADGNIDILGVTTNVPVFTTSSIVGAVANSAISNTISSFNQTANGFAIGSLNQVTVIQSSQSSAAGTVAVSVASSSQIDNYSAIGVALREIDSIALSFLGPFVSLGSAYRDILATSTSTVDSFTSSGIIVRANQATASSSINSFISVAASQALDTGLATMQIANYYGLSTTGAAASASSTATIAPFIGTGTSANTASLSGNTQFVSFTNAATTQALATVASTSVMAAFLNDAESFNTSANLSRANELIAPISSNGTGMIAISSNTTSSISGPSSVASGSSLVKGIANSIITAITSSCSTQTLDSLSNVSTISAVASNGAANSRISASQNSVIPSYASVGTGTNTVVNAPASPPTLTIVDPTKWASYAFPEIMIQFDPNTVPGDTVIAQIASDSAFTTGVQTSAAKSLTGDQISALDSVNFGMTALSISTTYWIRVKNTVAGVDAGYSTASTFTTTDGLGPDLVTGDNSTFTNGIGAWTNAGNGPTLSSVGGELLVSTPSAYTGAFLSLTPPSSYSLVSGGTYRVFADVRRGTAPGVKLSVNNAGTSTDANTTSTTTVTLQVDFTFNGGSYLNIETYGGSGYNSGSWYVDNVRLRRMS